MLFPVTFAPAFHHERTERLVEINLITIQPIVALAAGILILLVPRLLNYIVAIYLIVVGVAGLLA